MAVSAFRSTTRRSSHGGSGTAESSFHGSDPAPKPSHRRSRSTSVDPSQRYFSDCDFSSNGRRRGGRGSSARNMTSDSESDMDGAYGNRRSFTRSFEAGRGKSFVPIVTESHASTQKPGLRRTSSVKDFSDEHSRSQSHHYEDSKIKSPEGYAEEKTIRAVCAQMKSLRRDPPVGEVDSGSLYDAIRTEVRGAVTEIRKELEQSMKKNCSSVDDPTIESVNSPNTDVVRTLTDIRKEYVAKLEESEKKVQELWSQLAVEEQRSLEFSKILKELLPAPGSSSSRPQSHRRKRSVEKQVLLKRLDEDAQKYFEDFIYLSEVDLLGDAKEKNHRIVDSSDKSQPKRALNDVENSPTRASEDREVVESKDIKTNEESMELKRPVVGSDGVVLPWLHWESDSGTFEKTPKKDGKKVLSPRSNSSSNIMRSGTGGPHNHGSTVRSAKSESTTSTVKSSGKVNPNLIMASYTQSFEDADNYLRTSRREEPKEDQFSLLLERSLYGDVPSSEKSVEIRSDFDVDKFLVEKSRHGQRVARGEMVLCSPLAFEIV